MIYRRLLLLIISCTLCSGLLASNLNLLVFTKTTGFRHSSIEQGVDAMVKLCVENGFTMDHSEDANLFTKENLESYDVVVFLNTTGDVLNDEQQLAMENFIQSGGGFVGVHSATDTEYDWPWYGKMVGAYFDSHPKVQKAQLEVLISDHPSTAMLKQQWTRTDEWYNFKEMNPAVEVLINLDESSYKGGKNGVQHPFAWCHEYDGGRAFYTLGGHTSESFQEQEFMAHLLGGIIYAGGTNQNSLSQDEKDEGWKLLFDGKTTKGWRNYKSNGIGSSWVVENGALTLQVEKQQNGKTKAKDGGDIITEDQFENFELSLEWKIAPCGNSGIMYNVVEGDDYKKVYHTGPEIQVLDNSCHPDAKIHTHRAGDLYDMIACSEETVKPAGSWNKVVIKIDNGVSTVALNGHQLIAYTMFDDQWTKMIANSKFKSMPGFGTFRKGHIALQDHNDGVAFRNIKIRTL